jgi:hypothetical protein
MSEPYMTMAEIEAKYPNEWVLIDKPKVDSYADVVGGQVVWHHANRDQFDQGLLDHPLADSAIFFAGVLHPEPAMVISVWTDDSILD